jgi:hypothetical protein
VHLIGYYYNITTHGRLNVRFLNMGIDTTTVSQSPALNLLHGLPDPEERHHSPYGHQQTLVRQHSVSSQE